MDSPTYDAAELLRHLDWVRGLARSLVLDEATAEDVAQETILAALRGPPRERGAIQAWMRTVAMNLVRSKTRAEARRRRREVKVAAAEAQEGSIPDLVGRAEIQRMLVDFVLQLPEGQRTVVLLLYFEGQTPAGIARRLGISGDTVRLRRDKALAALRRQLDRTHGGRRSFWVAALTPLVPDAGPDPGRPLAVPATGRAVIWLLAAGITTGGIWFTLAENDPPEGPAAPAPFIASNLKGDAVDPVPPRKRLPDPEPPAPAAAAAAIGAVTGIVLWPDGRPFAGATVEARHDAVAPSARAFFMTEEIVQRVLGSTVTDARGEFAIPAATGVSFDLLVAAEGHADSRVADCSSGSRLIVRLEPEAGFFGWVTRQSDGSPVDGAAVICEVGGLDGQRYRVLTDRRGAWRIGGLESGLHAIDVHPGNLRSLGEPRYVRLETGQWKSVDLELASGPLITGSITDAVSGAPVEGASIRFCGESTGSRSGADGRYEFTGRAHFDYPLIVDAARHGRREVWLPPRSEVQNGRLTIDIELQPGDEAAGRLVGDDERPVAGARVIALAFGYHPGRPMPRRMSFSAPGYPATDWKETRTGPNGEFALAGLRPDFPHVLWVEAAGLARAAFDFPPRPVDRTAIDLGTLKIPRAVAVTGRVQDVRGRPLADCAITLWGANDLRRSLSREDAPLDLWLVDRWTGRSDAEGRFRFDDVAPGEYMAGTTLSTGRDVMTEPIRVTASGPAAQVVLEVDAGLSIAGKVVGPNGEPVAQALVQLIDATVMTGGRVLAIDEPGPDGLFEINGLAERSYTVLARRAPHLHAVTRYGVATLPDIRAGRRDIVLTLPFLAHLEIHVVDARGQDVRGAMVRLLSARGEESSGATVGSGIVRFSYPAYEAAELRVSPPNPPDGASRTTEQSIPVEPGDPGEQVMIEVVLDA